MAPPQIMIKNDRYTQKPTEEKGNYQPLPRLVLNYLLNACVVLSPPLNSSEELTYVTLSVVF